MEMLQHLVIVAQGRQHIDEAQGLQPQFPVTEKLAHQPVDTGA